MAGDGVTVQPFRPGRTDAKASLEQLVVVGDDVAVECYELGRYGRSVGRVFNGSMNFMLEQIKRG